ncbi:glycosyltransferase family A protein [Flagellimonas sp. DF-77]|uniref:glycosyltransferase family 2 protein n=1 Tax=Flagellimonas algarum TaxID=3230298 RepID=UPI0033969FE4
MADALPIVIVAYNRERSLNRLLDSIAAASYPDTEIPLIISIDHAEDNQAVVDTAMAFEWAHGEKKIIRHPENLGLRKHVLSCASLCLEYGRVIVLEDDLYVSPHFYRFTDSALRFSANDPKIGGVSLYNHQLNVLNGLYFSPIEDGYDNWYFQFASSWGQAWNKAQFEGFLAWYEALDTLPATIDLPEKVASWSEKSWLRYYIAYLIKEDKYFLYPKISLTTNFSDTGTHITYSSTTFQVPYLVGTKEPQFEFSTIGDSGAIYNAHFENTALYGYLGMTASQLLLDLGGTRIQKNQRFVLTKKILDFKIIKAYGRYLRPIELNILQDFPGNDFFLYDTETVVKNPNKEHFFRDTFYHLKYITHRNSMRLFLSMTKSRIRDWMQKFKR